MARRYLDMSNSADTISSVPTLSADGNLQRYLSEIRKFPMLAADEEYMLAKRWKEHEDSEAAHQLVTSLLEDVETCR